MLERYETQRVDRGTGRMTLPEAHQAAYTGMPSTLERIENAKLADRVVLFRRGDVEIYRNELRDGEWSRPPTARAALHAERERPFTRAELRDYAAGFDRIAALLDGTNRHATHAERREIETLRMAAHQELDRFDRQRERHIELER